MDIAVRRTHGVLHGTLHRRIKMYGIHEMNVGERVRERANRITHSFDTAIKILTPVAGNKDNSVLRSEESIRDCRAYLCTVFRERRDNELECVHDSIACEKNGAFRNILLEKVLSGVFCWSEMQCSDTTYNLPVCLFRPRRVQVVRSQSGLNMTKRYFFVKTGECCGKCRGSIAYR